MQTDFSGSPPGFRVRVVQLLAPRGGTLTDGVRLAAINAAVLIAAVLVLWSFLAVTRFVGLFSGLPLILAGFVAAIALVCGALYFWYRYAAAHGKAARLRTRDVRPDVFGVLAALPFVAVGLLLTANGLFTLFWAMFTFSLSRAGDGLQRLLFAVIFLGLAAANVIMARAAND